MDDMECFKTAPPECEMAGRRHPREEISAKLRQADELVNEGKTQREITRALGVSLMTYHRWRKMRERATPLRHAEPVHAYGITAKPSSSATRKDVSDARLEELQIENGRLRRLVTDLLLEKMKLEEELLRRGVAPSS